MCKTSFKYYGDPTPQNSNVAVYPIDDYCRGHHDVALLSREIVDLFIKQHNTDSFQDVLLRGLARRLTAITGGDTIQNINMLELLRKALNGEPMTEKDRLFSQDLAIQEIFGT